MDPQAEIRSRMRDREVNGKGRERQPRRDRASGGVKSEKNEEAAKQFEEERRAWRERNAAKLASGDVSSSSGVDEEDRMIQKGHELQQKNRESLANSIRMAKEATEVGQDTLMKLTSQKEQMKKMDDDLDKTNESLNRSERVIRGMKTTLGGIRNWLTKPTKHVSEKLDMRNVKVEPTADTKDDDTEGAAEPAADHTAGGLEDDEETSGNPRKVPLKDRDLSRESEKTRAALQTFQANQATEDEQLDDLGDLLGQLKGQAKDMNVELKVQEKLVDHLDNQIVKTGVRVKAADSNVKQIT